MRRRTAYLSLLGLALVIGFLVCRTPPDRSLDRAEATTSDAGPVAPSAPGTLAAPADQPGRPTSDIRGAAPGAPPPHPTIHIRALGDGRPATGAAIRVVNTAKRGWPPRPEGYGVPAPVGEDGILDVDASLVLDGVGFRTLWIEGTLEGWLSTPITLDVPETGADDKPFGGALNVTVTFRRAALVVGRVLAPDGTPIAATVQALFDEDTPAEGTRSFGEGVVASNGGRFRLSVDGEGASLFVAARGDARPSTTPVTLVRGRVVDVGDVRLERGTSLAGKIRSGGIPADRTNVIATWYGPGFGTARPARHGLLWVINRRAIWSQLEVCPDAEGHFRFDGLEPGPYRLRVPTEDWGCALHPDAYAEVDRIVRAPDEGLDIDADRSLLQLDIVDGTDAVPDPIVDVNGLEPIFLNGGPTGHVGVVLRAGARYDVTVTAKGYGEARLEVTAAAAGGRRLERATLTKAAPGSALDWSVFGRTSNREAVAVLGPDGVPLAVAFRLFDLLGTPVHDAAWDIRDVAAIRSTARTSISGPTSFRVLDVTPRHLCVEVGGGLFETKRIEFVASEDTPDDHPPSIVLHAR